MHVLEEMNAFMSDYETLQFLVSLQKQHKWNAESKTDRKHNKPYYHPELQMVTRDTVRYITQRTIPAEDPEEAEKPDEASPTNKKSTLLNLTVNQFSQLMRELNAFPLYKAEKLQIVNQLPTNLVHLYSIVEECESRLDEGQVTSLLECVSRTCL